MRRSSPFTPWGWAGIVLLIVGVVLLTLAFTSERECHGELEAFGSICSIVALIWIFADDRINGMRKEVRGMHEEMRDMGEEMRGMHEEMRGMHEEMRGMREEMRENFERLPRKIAEELKNLMGR